MRFTSELASSVAALQSPAKISSAIMAALFVMAAEHFSGGLTKAPRLQTMSASLAAAAPSPLKTVKTVKAADTLGA